MLLEKTRLCTTNKMLRIQNRCHKYMQYYNNITKVEQHTILMHTVSAKLGVHSQLNHHSQLL